MPLEMIKTMDMKMANSRFTINLPNSIKYINDNAFEKCRYLTKINIPDGVETLNCFSHCERLASLTFPTV